MSELTLRSCSNTNPTAVVASITSVQLIASSVNAQRRGLAVMNNSTSILYLLLGTGTASVTNNTVQMAANTYYEVPFSYTGAIQGIWVSANGQANITEFV